MLQKEVCITQEGSQDWAGKIFQSLASAQDKTGTLPPPPQNISGPGKTPHEEGLAGRKKTPDRRRELKESQTPAGIQGLELLSNGQVVDLLFASANHRELNYAGDLA